MEFEDIAAALEGVPIISRERGRELYDHVRRTRPARMLDVGTHRGASAAYMAAAAAANGAGEVTTVDHAKVAHLRPEALFERIGLAERISVVRIEHSSYAWWLKDLVAERSDAEGNVEPLYDFCYLDGAHNFEIDGISVVLIEKLLSAGGWLLLDDLAWTYEGGQTGAVQSAEFVGGLSSEERGQPHIRAVFDLIVRQHPAFTEFREDGDWGWAEKDPGAPRRYTVQTREPFRRALLRRLPGGLARFR